MKLASGLICAAVALAASLLCATAALGDSVGVEPSVRMSAFYWDPSDPNSPRDPTVDKFGCPGVFSRAAEVSLAVEPDSDRLVAQWMQWVKDFDDTPPDFPDVFSSNLVGYSDNGGQTWYRPTTVTGMSVCSEDAGATEWSCPAFDRPADNNGDPSVATGRDGTSYLAATGIYDVPQGGVFQIQANHSSDLDWSNGMTWSDVAIIGQCTEGALDFPGAVADPTLSRHAYLTYVDGASGAINMARTVDGGASWSTPVRIAAGRVLPWLLVLPGDTCPVTLPDGSSDLASCNMVLVFVTGTSAAPGPVFAQRSTDGGVNWSLPTQVAPPGNFVGRVAAGPPDAAHPDDQVIYFARWDAGKVEIMRSTDNGETWVDPNDGPVSDAKGTDSVLTEPGPTVAVDSHGTVGVLWYDTRSDRDRANPPTCRTGSVATAEGDCPLELWFAHSHNQGKTWTEQKVADAGDPTDLDQPLYDRFDIGDRISLVPLGDGFGAAWTRVPTTGNQSIVRYSHLVNQTGYPRPKGATPLLAALVPAYEECSSPNSSHGAPLEAPSCSPPDVASDQLTVGTPDANQRPAKSIGSGRFDVIAGDPATTDDEADVRIAVSISDVRRQSDLEDYGGELEANPVLRITDRGSGSAGADAATVSDLAFPVTVACSPTEDTTVGSTCAVTTTADTVLPGTVKEGSRAIWELAQLEVSDGGSDGLASTSGDNTPFARQGMFVP